ncbi:CDGSH iron-sulfur domain-containing protein [Cryobacterium zongtaii]|uniref:CDGSH iron-sulfur domain-containing protein n=1 Tax=Cryobacterium zongtaii TaxID=1259217 RepID=A0A2S3ZAT8_9MICO|nr:CDGSH iron-sulfur domain-containing protein [Cryobacterium zongtaii]
MTEPDEQPAQRWDDQWADQPAAGADEPVSITAYPNGPLLVRGTFEILTPSGEVIPPRRKTVALCRCGVSTLKPFCDGSHKAIGFKTEQEPPAPQPPLSA